MKPECESPGQRFRIGVVYDFSLRYSALLTLGSKGSRLRSPGVSDFGFAPVDDSANYRSEFFASLGQRVGEAWRFLIHVGNPVR